MIFGCDYYIKNGGTCKGCSKLHGLGCSELYTPPDFPTFSVAIMPEKFGMEFVAWLIEGGYKIDEFVRYGVVLKRADAPVVEARLGGCGMEIAVG